jgi:uncharacterized protein involved in outer membrane biogenesis
MKTLIIRCFLVILLLIVAGFGYLFYSLNSLVKKAVETVGPRITGTAVHLSSAALSPFSASGRLNGLIVDNPEGFKGPFALRAGCISVTVAKESLLRDPIVINQILIQNPEISLEGTLGGNNLGKLLQNIKGSSPSKTKGDKVAADSGKQRKFIIRSVVISGAVVHIAASALDQSVSQSLPLPEIRLNNIGSAGSVSADDLSRQILTALLSSATKEGVNALAKQGLQKLQQRGTGEIQKALQGLFK